MKKIPQPFLITFLLAVFLFVLACSKNEDEIYTPAVDILPLLADDVVNSTLDNPVEIDVLSNDNTGDIVLPQSVSIIGGTDTDANGTLNKLTVLGQGDWVVNPVTGAITFTSKSNFLGNPIKISYTAKDAQDNVTKPANVVINAMAITAFDISNEPFQKLSDYKFFVGQIKDQHPALNVIPYEPASSLFTDYAKKKRFVWMPPNTKATYNSDGTVLELPVGSILIKTFYYDNVQPNNTTRLIETRLMLRKATGWIFEDYVWNNQQTDAVRDIGGSTTTITWKDENNVDKSANYELPTQVQCKICHKQNTSDGTKYIPIGIKPQNLNTNFVYGTETKNQLTKWMETGVLNNINLPKAENSTVNYKDTSKPLAVRARSYVDINCAHCHQTQRHCYYRLLYFDFNSSGLTDGIGNRNLGVCKDAEDIQGNPLSNYQKIINAGDAENSMLIYRINTTNTTFRMPLHGRTIIHEEGVALMKQWINSLSACR